MQQAGRGPPRELGKEVEPAHCYCYCCSGFSLVSMQPGWHGSGAPVVPGTAGSKVAADGRREKVEKKRDRPLRMEEKRREEFLPSSGT